MVYHYAQRFNCVQRFTFCPVEHDGSAFVWLGIGPELDPVPESRLAGDSRMFRYSALWILSPSLSCTILLANSGDLALYSMISSSM